MPTRRPRIDEDDDDKPPAAVKAILSPMRANLEGVTIDYGLYGGRFWLPRAQAAEGSAQVAFMRVPFKMEESFKYASVNGDRFAAQDSRRRRSRCAIRCSATARSGGA